MFLVTLHAFILSGITSCWLQTDLGNNLPCKTDLAIQQQNREAIYQAKEILVFAKMCLALAGHSL